MTSDASANPATHPLSSTFLYLCSFLSYAVGFSPEEKTANPSSENFSLSLPRISDILINVEKDARFLHTSLLRHTFTRRNNWSEERESKKNNKDYSERQDLKKRRCPLRGADYLHVLKQSSNPFDIMK